MGANSVQSKAGAEKPDINITHVPTKSTQRNDTSIMNEEIPLLISGNEPTDLQQITSGLYGLLEVEGRVNRVPNRENSDLIDRITHPVDSSGRWAYTLYLIEDTDAFARDCDGTVSTADWILRAFDAGRSSAIHQRELALNYLSDVDHLFYMIQWRDLNGTVRFKQATAFPIRSRVERIGEETEQNTKLLGFPPDPSKIVSLMLQRHALRFTKVPDQTPDDLIAKAIVEACNLGLLYQSIKEESPLLAEIFTLHTT